MTHTAPPYRGLTWDHPRGHDALAASAGRLVHWDVQPLEGFESHPIDALCARYDLVAVAAAVITINWGVYIWAVN
ncbi:hypothetical protein ACWDVV_41605, partial [Streptomyces tendae]